MGLAEVTLTLVDPELAEAARVCAGRQQAIPARAGRFGVPDSASGRPADGLTEIPRCTEMSMRETSDPAGGDWTRGCSTEGDGDRRRPKPF